MGGEEDEQRRSRPAGIIALFRAGGLLPLALKLDIE